MKSVRNDWTEGRPEYFHHFEYEVKELRRPSWGGLLMTCLGRMKGWLSGECGCKLNPNVGGPKVSGPKVSGPKVSEERRV